MAPRLTEGEMEALRGLGLFSSARPWGLGHPEGS